jgi:hypothetical protein
MATTSRLPAARMALMRREDVRAPHGHQEVPRARPGCAAGPHRPRAAAESSSARPGRSGCARRPFRDHQRCGQHRDQGAGERGRVGTTTRPPRGRGVPPPMSRRPLVPADGDVPRIR